MKPKKDYIPTLDGWRAIAILAVMASHAVIPYAANHPWLRWMEQGTVGVDVFFALSGFLICSRLLAEHVRSGRIDWKGFYCRRAFRILPPYMTYLAALAVLAAVGLVTVSNQDWTSCLLFYRNYLGKEYWSWKTGHFWSLAVEEHFYVVFPALFAFFGPKRLRVVMPFLLVVLEAWRMADHRFQLFDAIFPGKVAPYRTDVRVSGIAYGCMAALLLHLPHVRGAAKRAVSGVTITAIAAGVLFCLYGNPPMSTLLIRILIAAMVAATTLAPSTLWGRFLELAPLRWVGVLSYSLYIWQQLFLAPKAVYAFHVFPVNVILAFVAAYCSYRWVEKPLMALGRKAGKSKDRAMVALAQTA